MPKIDLDAIPQSNATGYPAPLDAPVAGRWWRRLAPAAGLTLMGASQVVLKPGAWSSQRHWHAQEDELVVMVAGQAVLIEDGGETIVGPGDVIGWAAGVRDGHHLVNRGDADCVFVAIGAGPRGGGDYPDLDMVFTADEYLHRDGTPYANTRVR